MRLLTWNINSLRLRLNSLAKLVAEENPDIVCLQEIKVQDSEFPEAEIRAMGFAQIVRHGMKSYNGVAILSRLPFASRPAKAFCGREDSRHARVSLEDDIELQNFYVPAGGDVPDPEANDKFAHKLQFLDEMRAGFARARAKSRAIMVGDLNVAPLENDVWSHKQLLDVVSHTPIEVEKLNAAARAGKWVDAVRYFTPEPEKLFSWWSYRSPDWTRNDRGRRLDHVWVTSDLVGRLKAARIRRDMRGWGQPSDHVAVVVDFR
jgi:exodeoxyribonuclease-3